MNRHPLFFSAVPVTLLVAALFLLTGAVQGDPPGSDAAVTRQEITLAPGWNLISSHLTPSNPDLEAIFSATAGEVVLVKDGEGNIYSPEYGINTIGNWDSRESYMVFVSTPVVLQIEGTPARTDQPIALKPGWNLLSYLLSTPSPVRVAFSSLGDALVILKDNGGRNYLPEYDIDTIGELVPGQGYSAFVSRPADLVYAGSGDGPAFAYNPDCMAQPNHVLVEDFGTLTRGIAADSTQRAANTTAINAAIAAAPSPGVVCLPADSLYLTLDHVPTKYAGEPIILIARDSLTIWGAGACGWGDIPGCSYIGTPGDEYYYRGPVNNDGTDHLVRGLGIYFQKPVGGGRLPHVTLKGFELDGQSGWTGCYDYNYNWLFGIHYDCWDMGHKGLQIGSVADNFLVEDVKIHSYKGEIIYGNEPGKVTLRRVWSYDSNGSSFNVATPYDGLVEHSKFGPEVRFWSEHLADLVDNAKTTFRYNEFVDCKIVNGCIAIPYYGEKKDVTGQVWTWEHNTFTNLTPYKPAFLIETGPFELNTKNNTFLCPLFIANYGTRRTKVTITDNVIEYDKGWSFIFQGALLEGLIANNYFKLKDGMDQAWSGSPAPDLTGLVIENNTFDGFKTPGGARYAIIRNNTHLNFRDVRDNIGDTYDNIIEQFYNRHAVYSHVEGMYAELVTSSATDGQPLKLWNAGTKSFILPASRTQHGWSKDIVMKQGDQINLIYDASMKRWSYVD